MRPQPPTWLAGVKSATSPVVVEAREAREAADLAEAAGIEQQVDALAAGELAAVALAHHAGIVRAGRQPLVGDRLQGRDLVQHRRPAFVAVTVGAARAAPAAGLMTARICPPSTVSPTASGASVSTTPAQGAVTAVSIFMALTTISRSPAFTWPPSRTLMSTTEPASGFRRPRARPAPAADGPAARSPRLGRDRAPRPAGRGTAARRPSPCGASDRLGEQGGARIAGADLRMRQDGAQLVEVGRQAGDVELVERARRCGRRAESNVPEEFDWQISLASSGSNCGGGASPR